ncbi:MAG: VWA domain-containing protein [Polyangiaceae bacterium]|nr:VWA domain-containing protein [Polyangiaceae bacterium]
MGAAGGVGAGGSGATGGAGGSSGATGGTGGVPCVEDEQPAVQRPLTMVLLVDRSASMAEFGGFGQSRWSAVRMGLRRFLEGPEADQLYLGYRSFPNPGATVPVACTTDPDCGAYGPCELHDSSRVCRASTLPTPHSFCEPERYNIQLAIAPAAVTAPNIDLVMGSTHLTGNTSTSVALAKGIEALQSFGATNPGRQLAVVIATDSDPADCLPISAEGVAAIASAGLTGSPPVSTFIIGVTQTSSTLEQIAAAGSSPPAGVFLMPEATDPLEAMATQLRRVHRAALGCEFALPEPAVDPQLVNLHLTLAGVSSRLPQVASAASCAGEPGWFYRTEGGAPTGIELCPVSCQALTTTVAASTTLGLGCETVVR